MKLCVHCSFFAVLLCATLKFFDHMKERIKVVV